jgi:hypothetical protein
VRLHGRPDVVTLLDDVAESLDGEGLPFALIGASALAVHGVVRSTFDYDLLTTSTRVLTEGFWTGLRAAVVVDARRGDADDPLAGIVRLSAPGERDVDLVVGRQGWLDGVVARRFAVPMAGRDVYCATAADLVLLKLYSGGLQDRWDIQMLLETVGKAGLAEDVESRLSQLPSYAGALWQTILGVS